MCAYKMTSGTTVCLQPLSYKKSFMKYLLIPFALFMVISCQKGVADITTPQTGIINCDLLKQGLTGNDAAMISKALGKLLNEQYSNENLTQLAADISAGCDITASLECFDCIKTNPPQSAIQLSFMLDNGSNATYVLDLMPATDNTIKIVSVEQ